MKHRPSLFAKGIAARKLFVVVAVTGLAAIACHPALASPHVRWRRLHASRDGDWRKVGLWDTYAVYPVISGDSAVNRMASDVFRRDARRTFFQALPRLKSAEPGYIISLHTYLDSTLSIVDAGFVSGYVLQDNGCYATAPLYTYRTYNVGLRNDKPALLKLRDVLLPGVNPHFFSDKVIFPHLLSDMKKRHLKPWCTSLDADQINNFVVTPSGISWMFGECEVECHALGPFIVKISWSQLEGYIDPNGPLKPMLRSLAHGK